MEHKLLVKDSDNPLIIKFSEALYKQGLTDGCDCYYIDEDFRLPFFKIPKPYKKESPTDHDVEYIFVDVDDNPPFLENEEYTVQGNYVHEHTPNADDAAELVKKLYTGEVVEVAIIYPDRKASFFLNNTGDHKKNVEVLLKNADTIISHLKTCVPGGHSHVLFTPAYPFNLNLGLEEGRRIAGCELYAVSAVFSEHPEYYVLK